MLSVSSEGDSTTKFTANYTYDSNSNITKAADNNCTRTYTYNNANMLTVINNDGSGSLDTKYTYEYNYDGNVKKVTDGSGNQTIYGYDTNNRLIEETYLRVNGSTDEIFYSYDAFGNRSKLEYNCDRECVVNYIYDKNNRLINEEKLIYGSNKHYEIIDYSYDKNGNQISKAKYNQNIENKFTVSINDVNTDDSVGYEVFTYNRLNELTSYKNSKGTTATYNYLPNHYRMSKTVDGVLTQQIWDGENIVAEANDANAILRSYTWGNQLLTDDDRRAYMYDGHGNIVQQNRGTAAESVTRYDAYGNKIEKSGTTNDTPFGYCGEYLDKESGLIYLRNRYYDSESGRFISEDPIRDGVNWYAYCSGNPVAFVDFWGMFRIYYNPNAERIYDRYVAKPNNFFQCVMEIGVAFLPMGSALYEEYLRNNGMVYSSTMGYTMNDAIVDTGMYVASSIANRLGKSVVEKELNAYGYLVNIKNALDVITTDEVDSVVFNMFEISGIYANSSNLQYLAGVMQKSYDYVSNDFTYFFCQDIIPCKTLFSIVCEIMKETDAAKAEKLVQKYVTKYKCNVRTALGRDATDREVWEFEEQISNRDKFNYMINDFRQKVLS